MKNLIVVEIIHPECYQNNTFVKKYGILEQSLQYTTCINFEGNSGGIVANIAHESYRVLDDTEYEIKHGKLYVNKKETDLKITKGNGYKVITLCGSTKFKEEFIQVQKQLTLQGNIVISVGLFEHSGDNEVWEGKEEGSITMTKIMLDHMHKAKIDMADEIYVIDKDKYIGDSTRSEIEYAKSKGIPVRYYSEEN